MVTSAISISMLTLGRLFSGVSLMKEEVTGSTLKWFHWINGS